MRVCAYSLCVWFRLHDCALCPRSRVVAVRCGVSGWHAVCVCSRSVAWRAATRYSGVVRESVIRVDHGAACTPRQYTQRWCCLLRKSATARRGAAGRGRGGPPDPKTHHISRGTTEKGSPRASPPDLWRRRGDAREPSLRKWGRLSLLLTFSSTTHHCVRSELAVSSRSINFDVGCKNCLVLIALQFIVR